MSGIQNKVNALKESITKLLASSNNDAQPYLDILQELDDYEMTVPVLTNTLIGTVVSKVKKHQDENVKVFAKKLIKKWKAIVNQNAASDGNGNGGASKPAAAATKPTTPTSSSSKPTKPSPSAKKGTPSPAAAAAAPTLEADESEWEHLPPHRKKMASKFHETFSLSTKSLQKEGMNIQALSSLSTSRSAEVEEAVHVFSKGVKANYSDKLRSLLFNMKKNEVLRNQVLLGQLSSQELVTLPSDKLATAQNAKRKSQIVQSQQDSWRLDWDRENESKVNEICGIKGDLLKASLFTCGRCKSTKTTSTQKQTRSADEPMTVFVFCMNCGNRWKC